MNKIQEDKKLLNMFANYYYLLNNIIDNLNGYLEDTKYINKYQSVEMIKNTFDTLSVRELESITNEEDFTRKNKINKKIKSSEYNNLEKDLTEYYGTKVKISNKKLIELIRTEKETGIYQWEE